jgi:carbonic anhydrase
MKTKLSNGGLRPQNPTQLNSTGLAILAALFLATSCATDQKQAASPPSEDPLTLLEQGNQRFVEGHRRSNDLVAERAALASGQHPYAVILTCADSRVAPELIFDESLGRLFVIRVAGNVADPVVLGSIEYAVEHLHAHLLLVMGHDSCGAVKAAIEGGAAPPNIEAMLAPIAPAVAKVKAEHREGSDAIAAVVRENVVEQVKQATAESAILAEAVKQNHLQIVGAVYHLASGKVELISSPK